MTIQTFKPPGLSFRTEVSVPGIFLAGPILGVGDWQEDADGIIREIAIDKGVENLAIFNPRRPEFKDLKDFDDDTFFEQVNWEHEHLAAAKNRGVRLFWLCNQTVDMPHRKFALTTMFELGEAIGYAHDITGDAIVVAIEPGWTNEKYLEYTIKKKAPKAILAKSLEGACYAAVTYIADKYK